MKDTELAAFKDLERQAEELLGIAKQTQARIAELEADKEGWRKVAVGTAELERLTRWEWSRDGMEIRDTKEVGLAPETEYVTFADVQALLSTQGNADAARVQLVGGNTNQVGCEGADGLLRLHEDSETCDVCATAHPSGAAQQPGLAQRLSEMENILRDGSCWNGNEYNYAAKDESDVAMLVDLVDDAIRLSRGGSDADQAWNGELPELPEMRAIRAGDSFPKVYALAYTADQIQEYARKAVGAALEAVREDAPPQFERTDRHIGSDLDITCWNGLAVKFSAPRQFGRKFSETGLLAFAAAVENSALEAAAKACESEIVENSGLRDQEDHNYAAKQCAKLVRSIASAVPATDTKPTSGEKK